MTIVLTYTSKNSTQEQVAFEDDVTEIRLAGWGITSIDLTPLSSCSSLQTVDLGRSWLPIIIIHSWLCTVKPKTSMELRAVYRRPMSAYPWAFLRQVAEQFGTDRRVQQDILHALGLQEYGFIDCDLSELFCSLPGDTPFEIAREQVREALVYEIAKAVDKNKATTGLKLEELLTKHGEIAKRAQQIIKLRDAEIKQVRVHVRDNEVDLRQLWLTAYGYEILIALGMHLTINLEGLEQIKGALAELGFELKTGETSVAGVKMSKKLKQAIWWIVENRGRPWREIGSQIP